MARIERTMLRSCMNWMTRVVSAGASSKRSSASQSQSASGMMRSRDNNCMAQTERGEGSIRRFSGGKSAGKRGGCQLLLKSDETDTASESVSIQS